MPQSTPTPSNAIPEDDFAVVRDNERKFIVDAGRYSDMVELAALYNETYHSTAYSARLWVAGLKY
jgi:hypothetical protein